MTQARVKFNSFAEYLDYSDAMSLVGRYELVRGELVELPPESRLNSTIAICVLLALITKNWYQDGQPIKKGRQDAYPTRILSYCPDPGVRS
ncbi:hypothetical protein [Egbenema bharatensis]|uniref:hypothetical protein n=1 Tax=Egbenema bharatensis TaxID=3463334 RepID=UPI003A89179F